MKKKILITGSSGFVGTNFIRLSPDFDIRVADLLIQKTDDIDFAGIDSVLHLAALVHQMKGASEADYFKVNCDLAYEMAKKSKSKGVRHFVLMSTVKVYGESTQSDQYWDEESICNPADGYGRSKLAAEKLVQSIADESFSVAIVRSPLVYGAGVKANMFNLIKLTDRFPLLPFGGINNKRSMVYIGNLVALLNYIIQNQASGIFLAGNNFAVSTNQLVCQIAKSLKKKRIIFTIPGLFIKVCGYFFPAFIRRLTGSLVLDNSKTNSILKFNPPYSFEYGIDEMVDWYIKSFKRS